MRFQEVRERWCIMNSNNLYRIGWYFYIITFLVTVGVCAWWLFYPYEPITIDYIKIVNPNKEVMAGHLLTYEIKYTKKMDISGTLSRKLRNSYNIELADVAATARVGSDSDFVTIPIPRFADKGSYILDWSASYQVNPLRRITVQKSSDQFQVLCDPQNVGAKGIQGEHGIQGIQGKQGERGEKGGIAIFGIKTGK